jgi:hypothetical protein
MSIIKLRSFVKLRRIIPNSLMLMVSMKYWTIIIMFFWDYRIYVGA